MRFPGITSPVIFTVFVASAVWLVLVVTAPYMVPAGMFTDLSGTTANHENEDLFEQVHPVPHAVYWIGDAECHQLANRSYFLNDNQMPFCARDLGIFAGVTLGFGFVAFVRFKVHPLWIFPGLAPLAVDGTVQLLTSYESSNPLRLATGVAAGAACALLLAHFIFVIQEDHRPQGPSDGQTGPAEGGQP